MNEELDMMVFHITPLCENRCEYCYMGGEGGNKHPQYSKIKRVMGELIGQGVKKLLLGGGNPCTFPYLGEVIKLGYDLNSNIEIISNTLEFKDRKILEHVIGFDATILGPNSSAHDKVARRKGAYHFLISNIKKLVDDGFKVGIVLNATPQTYNMLFDTVRNIIEAEHAPPNSIRYVMIQRVIPKGRASNTLKYSVKKEHLKPLFADIENIEKTYKLKIVFEDAFPLCVIDKKYHKYLSPCVWGYTKGSINWNGDVARCGADPRFKLGNIFEKPLNEIWEKSPILLSFRSTDWLPLECKKCQLLEECRCGCPLSSITESDHKPDILCPFSLSYSERYINRSKLLKEEIKKEVKP
jgi:radical SAM protein with 4Fe4S-binding SPASM domain